MTGYGQFTIQFKGEGRTLLKLDYRGARATLEEECSYEGLERMDRTKEALYITGDVLHTHTRTVYVRPVAL